MYHWILTGSNGRKAGRKEDFLRPVVQISYPSKLEASQPRGQALPKDRGRAIRGPAPTWGWLTSVCCSSTLPLNTQHGICDHLTALPGVGAEGGLIKALDLHTTIPPCHVSLHRQCDSEATSLVSTLIGRTMQMGKLLTHPC